MQTILASRSISFSRSPEGYPCTDQKRALKTAPDLAACAIMAVTNLWRAVSGAHRFGGVPAGLRIGSAFLPASYAGGRPGVPCARSRERPNQKIVRKREGGSGAMAGSEAGGRRYSLKELYWIVYHGMRSLPHMVKARRKKELGKEFTERIMLAVTQVNGCAVCSYAHTRMALEAGLSSGEIRDLLSGVLSGIPSVELPAILFAQHYADQRGKPARGAWDRVMASYGLPKSLGILGAIRMIMIGNAYGIAWSSFFRRFSGKPDRRSTLPYEAGVIILGSILVPFAAAHALLASLVRARLIDFRG